MCAGLNTLKTRFDTNVRTNAESVTCNLMIYGNRTEVKVYSRCFAASHSIHSMQSLCYEWQSSKKRQILNTVYLIVSSMDAVDVQRMTCYIVHSIQFVNRNVWRATIFTFHSYADAVWCTFRIPKLQLLLSFLIVKLFIFAANIVNCFAYSMYWRNGLRA